MAEQKAATPAKKRTATTASATKTPAASKPKAAKPATATTAKKSAAKKITSAATATRKATAKPAAEKSKVQPTPEERYRMVETAAYFIAERHGFQGDSTGHWVAAEAEIAALLGK